MACVFLSASISFKCSSPPLPFNSSPFSNTERNANTHQKRPSGLKISRLCSSYFLPSYLSVNVGRMLVGSLSWQRAHTHTNCCPTLCSLGKHTRERWGLLPSCHLQTSLLRFLVATLMQVNITSEKPKYVFCFTYFCLHHRCDVDVMFLRAGWYFFFFPCCLL